MQIRKQGSAQTEHRKEEEFLRWINAGQEEHDEFRNELALEMENEILSKRGIEKKSFHWKRRATEVERRRGDVKKCQDKEETHVEKSACSSNGSEAHVSISKQKKGKVEHEPKKWKRYMSIKRGLVLFGKWKKLANNWRKQWEAGYRGKQMVLECGKTG